MKRFGIAPVLAMGVLLAGAGHAAFGQATPAGAAPATSPAARTVTVTATLEAFESTDLFAKDAGFLSDVKADMGDHVKKGQVLAVVDDPELEKQVQSAQASLAARKELAKAAEATVEQSQKSLEVVKSQRAGYEAELGLAQATLKRQEELFGNKAITNQQLDEARAKAEVARAQSGVAAAKVAGAEADVQAAQANLAVAKSQIVVADAEVQRFQTLLQYTQIVAPFDGVITRRMVSRGDLVQSGTSNRGTPLFTCQRIDVIRVFCDVPETNAVAIVPGTAASVRLFGLNNQVVTGKVTRVATALNAATRTMRAEVDLPNPDEKLRPGMYAQVTLTLPEVRVAESPRP